ncbi:hypothetical protein NHQ30_006108 [Ciborinia camelliae]|nr:hypothetical protein NHQ30_006108 [Ciborinia camelliae]
MVSEVFQYLQSLVGIFKPVPTEKDAPKICIIAMFGKEAENWLSDKSELKCSQKIALPGLSRGYNEIFFTEDNLGYVPMGAESRDSFPRIVHGPEVYELNDALRQASISFAQTATLEDSSAAAEHRALYSGSLNGVYRAATLNLSIIEGDVASSNTFWHGKLLCECMEKVVKTYTSNSAVYVMTAQELYW